MGRPKKPATELSSVQECTVAMGELLGELGSLEALVALRDVTVARAQAELEPRIDACRARAAELQAALKAYYYAHLAELEDGGKRKSFTLPNGVMGRRFGPGRLAPLNRSWTWKATAIKVRELFGMKYFRAAEPELDKQALKDRLDAEALAKAGLCIKNDEEFYAEPARPDEPTEVKA